MDIQAGPVQAIIDMCKKKSVFKKPPAEVHSTSFDEMIKDAKSRPGLSLEDLQDPELQKILKQLPGLMGFMVK